MNGLKSNLDSFIDANGGSIRLAVVNFCRRMAASDFVQKVSETFTTRIMMLAVGLVTSVIIARSLGPEGRGFYAVALAVSAIGVQFGNLGLPSSNTYFVAGDRSLLPALVGNSLIVSFILGTLCTALAYCIFLIWPRIAPVSGVLLLLSLSWIPFGLAYLLMQYLILGIQDVRSYNVIELGTRILSVILVGIVIFANLVTVETVFLTSLAAPVIGFAWAMRKLWPHLKAGPSPSLSLFRKNIWYGFKAYIANLFAFLLIRTSLIIVKQMAGAEQAGYYSITVSMVDMIFMLPVVIGVILFPRLSAIADENEKWKFARKSSFWTGLLMFGLSTASALLSGPMVWLLYGKEFMPAVPAFIWMTPGIVLLSINTIYMNYFASIGMPPVTIYSPAVAFVLNVALNIYLIPILGLVGASISATLTYGVMLIISIVYISRTKGGFLK